VYNPSLGPSNQVLDPPSNPEDMFSLMHTMGASIFSNSWGVDALDANHNNAPVSYGDLARGSDQFMWDYPDSLVLYANGNTGDPATGSVNAISTVNQPATFKNGLSVGAGLNDYQSWQAYSFGAATSDYGPNALAKFSSRGPTFDGRMKPDIVAPGIYSLSK
jgi:hypothetical protein